MAESSIEKKKDSLMRIIQRKLKYQKLRAKIKAKKAKEDIKSTVEEIVDNNVHNLRKGVLTTAILASSLNLSAVSSGNSERSDSKPDNVELTTKAKQATFNVSSEEMAEAMLAKGQNTLENFDINNYKFSAEDLEMLSPGEQGKKFSQILLKNARGSGGQCLKSIRLGLAKIGINEQFGLRAYMAADVLRQNENFVILNCDVEDFLSLPNGAIVIRGKGNTPSGHAGGVVNHQDVSDRVRTLRTDNKRWSSGLKYGEADVFAFKTTEAEKDLMIKFIDAGCLKQETENEMLAEIAANNGKKGEYVLLTKNQELNKKIDFELKIAPVESSVALANYIKMPEHDADNSKSLDNRKKGWREQHAARRNNIRGG